eukprot:776574-Amphidinium_carterae.1
MSKRRVFCSRSGHSSRGVFRQLRKMRFPERQCDKGSTWMKISAQIEAEVVPGQLPQTALIVLQLAQLPQIVLVVLPPGHPSTLSVAVVLTSASSVFAFGAMRMEAPVFATAIQVLVGSSSSVSVGFADGPLSFRHHLEHPVGHLPGPQLLP